MTRLTRQSFKVERLRPSIPLAERMDVIDVADDFAGLAGEGACGQALEIPDCDDAPVNIGHPGSDVLAELKRVAAFGNLDGPKLAGPVVDILEQVPVNRAEVSEVEAAGGVPC